MYDYNARVLNVVDGDTMDLDVDVGFHLHNHIRVRLLGINTPEKFGEERPLGEECKAIAKEMFEGKAVKIQSEKEITDVKTDSFGRWLVKLWDADGKNVIDTYNGLGINKLNPETYKWAENSK